MFEAVAAIIFGYFIGSIPFGLLVTRAAGLGDVRQIGSGNIGATNVLRTGSKKLAALTLLLDALKGTVAVLVAGYFEPRLGLLAGAAAFIGHLYPLWLNFKGGKGVATYVGVLLAVAWKAALIFAIVWIAIAALLRYSSLAALIATIVAPIALWLFGAHQAAMLFLAMSLIVWFKHRANISRLLNKTEPRIGSKG